MMANFMDQHVTHQAEQILTRFDPFQQDGFAEQQNAVRFFRHHGAAFFGQRYAKIKPGQFIRVFDAEFAEHFLLRDVIHQDCDAV